MYEEKKGYMFTLYTYLVDDQLHIRGKMEIFLPCKCAIKHVKKSFRKNYDKIKIEQNSLEFRKIMPKQWFIHSESVRNIYIKTNIYKNQTMNQT